MNIQGDIYMQVYQKLDICNTRPQCTDYEHNLYGQKINNKLSFQIIHYEAILQNKGFGPKL